ncbi:MAG: hypothetical protein Q8N18_13060 [Opitutaceae bacterium]|nr:hypothetical protein [Opitutaceae bacterium]
MPRSAAPAAAAAAPAEGMKFKLKPRTEPAPAASEVIAALNAPGATIPPVVIPATIPAVAVIPGPPPALQEIPALAPEPKSFPKPPEPAPASTSSSTRPPFTRAPLNLAAKPDKGGASLRRTVPPFAVPHLKVSLEVPEVGVPPAAAPVKRGSGRLLVALLVLVVLGAGGYFGWQHFGPKPATPAAPAALAAVAAAVHLPNPTETLNQIAHIPVNAINKAQDVIAARRASGQTRVDAAALGEDQPDKPAPKPLAAPPPNTALAMTAVAPGLAATTRVEAASASPAFVAWVVNAKINGIFQGTPARAMINGRLVRAGEIVDPALGISFDHIEADRKQIIFKDTTGATVVRKY